MSKKSPAAGGAGLKSAGAKDDVVSYRVGLGVNRPGGRCGELVGVHAHTAEVVSKVPLHNCARRQVEGLAG